MSGKKGLKQETKKTKEQLEQELSVAKMENEQAGLNEINAILEKRKLTITTQVPVHISGQPLGVIIKSL